MAEQNRQTPDVNEQIKIRMDKLKALQEAGNDPFQITKYDVTYHTKDIKDNFDELEGKQVSIAGRLMQKRVMGKASFGNVADLNGNIQIYVARDSIGEEPYAAFKKFDIGDIVGGKGEVFRTQKGEMSIHVSEITLLTKSLQVLPEKFHGLTDTEIRYRQRYLDLIMNPEVKTTFVKRSQIIKEIRNFLDGRDFMEVERVYEIGRVFRNEGVDTRHNPEFTLMELYQAYTDYYGMMELAESLYRTVCEKVNGTTKVKYGDVEIDFSKPFERITMLDAVKKYSGVDFTQIKTDEEAKAVAKEKGVAFEDRHKKGDILNLFFEEFVEEHLIQPTFVMDHPLDISPLTKKKPDAPEYVERFELFMNGWEMANAYSELNDPIDQRERFAAQDALADAGDEEANHTDEDFLNALAYGMPPTGGIGFGIDRMVMLLTDSAAIRDVLLFPTMKSIGGAKAASESEGAASGDNNGFFTPNDKIDFSKVKVEPLFEEQVDFETFSKSDFRAVKVKECVAVPKSKKLLQLTLDDGTGTDRTILSGIHAFYEPEELVGKTLIAIINLPPRKMMGIESCGMLLSAVNNLKDSEDEELHLLMVDNHIPAGAKLY